MECSIGKDEVECIKCGSFKMAIDISELLKKIAQILGVKEGEVEELAEGYLLPNDVVVKCKEEFLENWTDYCIRCYASL